MRGERFGCMSEHAEGGEKANGKEASRVLGSSVLQMAKCLVWKMQSKSHCLTILALLSRVL